MLLRNAYSKIWRKAIDILVILPAILFIVSAILDRFIYDDELAIVLCSVFFLALAIIVKGWMKPRPTSELIDQLLQDELFLKKKIGRHQKKLEELAQFKTRNDSLHTRMQNIKATIKEVELEVKKVQETIQEYQQILEQLV